MAGMPGNPLAAAKRCFDDNLKQISLEADPVTYNLNKGLSLLVEQLDADLGDLVQKLDDLRDILESRQPK